MSSLAEEVARLERAKSDIKVALRNKNLEIPDSYTLSSYADMINSLEVGTDTSEGTATEYHIAEGFTAFVKSQKIVGKLAKLSPGQIQLSATGVLSIPAGTYTELGSSVTYILQEADDPVITDNTVSIPAGYRSQVVDVVVGTAIENYSCMPGSTDIIIPANTYLRQPYTIFGSSELQASNIKKGITIFGVVGSYEGLEAIEFENPATAADVRAGFQFINNAGELLQGALKNLTSDQLYVSEGTITIPADRITTKLTLSVSDFKLPEVSATAEKILSGFTAYDSHGELLEGTCTAVSQDELADITGLLSEI